MAGRGRPVVRNAFGQPGDVPILITLSGSGFDVSVSPPEGPSWESASPLTATEVLEQLSSLGCHSTDVTDALDATGVAWRDAHDAEVRRRRKR